MSIDGGGDQALYRLMAWLSPAFPVGAFSYSHGLEWLIEAGAIRTEPDLQLWLGDLLDHGSAWSDAIFFVHAYEAASRGTPCELMRVAVFAAAFSPSAERHLEASAQGEAFARTVLETWPAPTLRALREKHDGALVYPVAVAIAAADHGIALRPALIAFLHAATANLISAGVRLIPLGQTAGQRITAGMEPAILKAADRAPGLSLDDAGGSLVLTDMASMFHETQYTRLFRS